MYINDKQLLDTSFCTLFFKCLFAKFSDTVDKVSYFLRTIVISQQLLLRRLYIVEL